MRRRLLTILAVAGVCCGAVRSGAEEDPSALAHELVIRSWATESGLPQNTVTAMAQTRDGYLWIGSRDGLARFDGVRFTLFGLRDGLRSVEILSLFEDSRGRLYIGTSGGGVSRFHSGRVESLPLPVAHTSAAGQIVSAFAEDTAGRLWIGTRAGLHIRRADNFEADQALKVLADTAISALAGDRRGRMWIATANRGLFLYDDGVLEEVRGPPGNELVLAYCLLLDQAANLWAAVGNGVLLCRIQDQWRVYNQTNGVPYAYITSLAQEASGTLWAGSLDEGLFYFKQGSFFKVTTRNGLSSDDIRSLLPDREGNLWVGTRSAGLNRVNRRKVQSWGRPHGMTNDFARGVAETADGTLWVGITGGGLYRGSSGRFTSFGPEPVIRSHPFVETVLATEDGALWWGASRGLFCWQDDRLAAVFTNEAWIISGAVTALSPAHPGPGSHEVRVWAGTSEGRLVLCSQSSSSELSLPVARGAVTGLIPEADGSLWVGSSAGGLKRLSPDRQSVVALTNGLASQSIRTLYRDGQGTLWIGTAGAGLALLRDGQVRTVERDYSFGVETISQILKDDKGCLWLGTSRGIFRVPEGAVNQIVAGERPLLHPQVFGLSHGMPTEECSSGFFPAGLKTRAGLLCFPTIKGLVTIDPNRQEPDPPLSEVLIEQVLVRGKTRRPEASLPDAAGDAPVPALTLRPGEREFEISYTAVNFRAPEQVRFRYRLKGFEDEWVEAGPRRIAHYPRAGPGEFRFEVTACNPDGVWCPPARLGVIIEPFLWEQTWFRFVLAVLSLAAFTVALRFSEHRKYQRQLAVLHTQAAVEKERLRISQDMHDHIGGILTQVSLMSDLGQDEPEAQAPSRFRRIGQQVRAAIQALDEIIWATNPRNDNLPRFVEYISRVADECFDGSGIRCWQELPANVPNVPLRADVRHNFFLAVREAFNNVLKHSRATEVWLRVVIGHSSVSVVVEDNGCGFGAMGPHQRGNGFTNMNMRMTECGGSFGFSGAQGARVSFTVPIGAMTSGVSVNNKPV